jgi:hypothetical protein
LPWWKVCDQADSNPKLSALSDAALRLWFQGGVYCARSLSDGHIPADRAAGMAFQVAMRNGDAAAWEGLIEELCTPIEGYEAPLWHRREDGSYRLHDWEVYNPNADETREKRREKAELLRLRRMGIYASDVIPESRFQELPGELARHFQPVEGGHSYSRSREPNGNVPRNGSRNEPGNVPGTRRSGEQGGSVPGNVPPSRPRPRSPSRSRTQGGLGDAAVGQEGDDLADRLAVVFPAASEMDRAVSRRWLADGLDLDVCLRVVAMVAARQLVRGDPMQSLAYADQRIRGEGLPQLADEDIRFVADLNYQRRLAEVPGLAEAGLDTEDLLAAEEYARRLHREDKLLGGWAYHGVTTGHNQVANRLPETPKGKEATS